MIPLARCLVLLSLFLLAACGNKEPIRIGFLGSLSGPSADLGEAGRNGTLLAVEEINARGGIGGRPIELLIRNTTTNPDTARETAETLLASHIDAAVGGMTSGIVKAMLPAFNARQVVLISPTAASDDLAGQDDYLFRMNTTTAETTRLYARYCQEKGYRRVMIVAYRESPLLTSQWIQEFRGHFEATGGVIAGDLRFEAGSGTDLRAIVSEAHTLAPDLLIFIANAGDVARLAQESRKRESSMPLGAAEWAGTDDLIQLGGRAVDGMALLLLTDERQPPAGMLDFRDRYLKRFGHPPSYSAIFAYDAAHALGEAIERSQGRLPLKTALQELGPFAGLEHPIRFDRYGDTERTGRVALIRDGRYTPEP